MPNHLIQVHEGHGPLVAIAKTFFNRVFDKTKRKEKRGLSI